MFLANRSRSRIAGCLVYSAIKSHESSSPRLRHDLAASSQSTDRFRAFFEPMWGLFCRSSPPYGSAPLGNLFIELKQSTFQSVVLPGTPMFRGGLGRSPDARGWSADLSFVLWWPSCLRSGFLSP